MTERPRAKPCPSCGALNGAEFDRCVRCHRGLQGAAQGSPYPDARPAAPPRASPRAPATWALIVATSVVFAGQAAVALAGGAGAGALIGGTDRIALIRFGALLVIPELLRIEPWRVLSAVFVHADAVHLVMNLYGLALIGRVAEPTIGAPRLVLAYLASGVGGYVASVAVELFEGRGGITLGSSGAVFGLLGLILGIFLRRRDPRWKRFAVLAVGVSILFGFAVNASSGSMAINNAAHIGGLAIGLLFGLVYGGAVPARASRVATILAGIGACAALASLVAAQVSPVWRMIELELQ